MTGSLKKKRLRKQTYRSRSLAKADVFDCPHFSTTETGATATSAASVLRRLNPPQKPTSECLRKRVDASMLLQNLKDFTMKSVLSAIAIGILTLGVSGTASGQAEVWTGSSNATGPVSRFDLDGNLLASFNSDSSLSAMIVVPEATVGILMTTALLTLACLKRRASGRCR